MRRVAALAIAFVAATTATSSGVAGSEVGPPIVGGTKPQRVLLRDVVAALGGTQISHIRIAPLATGEVRLVMRPARFDRARANLSVRLEWDAHIVTYSLLRLSRAKNLPTVGGFSVAGKEQSFRTTSPRPLPSFDRARIVPQVGRTVRRSGADLIEFNLFRPAGPAFAVVVRTERPARFIEERLASIITALNDVARRLDGFYVAVTDARRRVVFAYGRVELRGQSSATLYLREDLRGCAETLPVSVEVAPDGAPPCPRA